MISADTLALLMAKGLAGDDLLEVVRSIAADAAAAQPVAAAISDKAKAGAAVRMARYRETRRSLGLDPHFSGKAITPALRERDGEGCIYCGVAAATVDHITPTSQGGCDSIDNLGLACNPCNGGKAGRTPKQAGMTIISKTAEFAYVRYCSGRTVRGEQDAKAPLPVPQRDINQTPHPTPKSSLRSESAKSFADFWLVVPRKTGKDAAEKAYRRIVGSGRASPESILAGAIRWRDESRGDDPQFIPHPATWLNRGGWEDEPRPPRQSRAGPVDGMMELRRGLKRVFDVQSSFDHHDQRPTEAELADARAAPLLELVHERGSGGAEWDARDIASLGPYAAYARRS